MKSKIILGLATLVGLALPSFAAQTYCRLDNDGDRQICTTYGYDAYGNYFQRNFSRPVYNGYYGGYYNNGYYNNGFYGNRDRRDYDGDRWRDRREHEERERREHREHEYREHHRDRDHDGDYR